ncbi:MAG: hypothetical protein WCN95_07090 [bacterium]
MSDIINLPKADIDILRRLAERKVKLANDPVNEERREAWYLHDAGSSGRPMVLAEYGGVQDKIRPFTDAGCQCTDPWARSIEVWQFMAEAYQFESLKDDHVIEPYLTTGWHVGGTDYGVQAVQHHGDNDGRMGSRRWDPPIVDFDRDFQKLRPRTWSVNRESSLANYERLKAIFGDILTVRFRSSYWWTMGMTWAAIDLIGLESLMLWMYDNPAALHRVMAFLRDDHLAHASWMEKEGLLTINNENDYMGSGSMGYTRDLPKTGRAKSDPVRLEDLWVLLESQETVGVGPDLFEEFIFPYQLSIAEKSGKVYYGCCEPVHNRWHVLKRLPHLARVSISPWADEEFMAKALGTDIIYSRKPNPTLISTDKFDEVAIRADIRKTLTTAKGCRIELIMKDVHTLNEQPGRLARWVELARETISEVYGN